MEGETARAAAGSTPGGWLCSGGAANGSGLPGDESVDERELSSRSWSAHVAPVPVVPESFMRVFVLSAAVDMVPLFFSV
jgi:hypothetical protein